MSKMTPKQIEISKKLFDDVQNALFEHNRDMAKEVQTEKGVALGDFLVIGLSAKATMDTVFLAIVNELTKSMGKDIGNPEVTENLLVDIVANSMNKYLGDVMPMVLGQELTGKVVDVALNSKITGSMEVTGEIDKLKQALKDIDPGKSFEEIITEAKGAKRTH